MNFNLQNYVKLNSLREKRYKSNKMILRTTCLHLGSQNPPKSHLGGLLGRLGASREHLGASWVRLGAPPWGFLGASWEPLGPFRCQEACFLCRLGDVSGRLGSILGASRASGGVVEVSCACFSYQKVVTCRPSIRDAIFHWIFV